MTDSEKIAAHDKDIAVLTQSTQQLVNVVKDMGDRMLGVAVLVEKFANLEHTLEESFSRVHEKANHLDLHCAGAKSLEKDKEVYEEKLKVANKRIADLETITSLVPTLITNVQSLLDARNLILKTVAVILITAIVGTVITKII